MRVKYDLIRLTNRLQTEKHEHYARVFLLKLKNIVSGADAVILYQA